MIQSINPSAKIRTCVRGAVPDPLSLVGSAKGKGAADWGILDEHRKLVQAVEKESAAAAAVVTSHDEHDHDHQHNCHDASCNDPSHHHDHDHEHTQSCHDAQCTHPAHKHDHDHDHGHSHACHDSKCTDPTHQHDHEHGHSHSVECHDHQCNDPTHDHSHSHNHDETTAEQRFGITSFVYKRRRPFHPLRFTRLLRHLGTLSVTGVSNFLDTPATAAAVATTTKPPVETPKEILNAEVIEEDDEEDEDDDYEESVPEDPQKDEVLTNPKLKKEFDQVRSALLRSKGFIWMATSKSTAYFVSHAGQFLDLVPLGRWWGDIDKSQWPENLEKEILYDFEGKHGDRRQELVFIGQFGKEKGRTRQSFEYLLDQCLLTDEEMEKYEQIAEKGVDDELLAAFDARFA